MANLIRCPVCCSEVHGVTKQCFYDPNHPLGFELKHDYSYYMKKANERKCDTFYLIYLEVKENPLFDQAEFDNMMNSYSTKKVPIYPEIQEKLDKARQKHIPKCPTCQSTNIKKISSVSKAVHGFAFGLFSKTAKSQFECNDCHYKW